MIKFIFSYTKYIKSYFITVLFLIGTLTILNSLKPIILSGTFNLIVKELNFQLEVLEIMEPIHPKIFLI